MKDDRLISLSAAIDAVHKNYDTILDFRSDGETVANSVEDILSELPVATDTNVATTDTISRQAAIDAVEEIPWYHQNKNGEMVHGANDDEHQAWYKAEDIYKAIESVPSAQTEPAIPLSWIEGQIEWLKSLDNDFSILTAGQISAMVNKWKDERNEQSD